MRFAEFIQRLRGLPVQEGIGAKGGAVIQRPVFMLVAGLVAACSTIGAMSDAIAQGAPQSVTERRVDVVQTGQGFRASKLAGATVYNRDKDRIGTIDDLILSPADRNAFAIVSVGGFLGIGKHYVAVPFSSLQISDKQVLLPDATKQSIESLPEFKYAPD
ncbi:PRC-barrel domain-containing protein [Paraburkholderia sp. 2C]